MSRGRGNFAVSRHLIIPLTRRFARVRACSASALQALPPCTLEYIHTFWAATRDIDTHTQHIYTHSHTSAYTSAFCVWEASALFSLGETRLGRHRVGVSFPLMSSGFWSRISWRRGSCQLDRIDCLLCTSIPMHICFYATRIHQAYEATEWARGRFGGTSLS